MGGSCGVPGSDVVRTIPKCHLQAQAKGDAVMVHAFRVGPRACGAQCRKSLLAPFPCIEWHLETRELQCPAELAGLGL